MHLLSALQLTVEPLGRVLKGVVHLLEHILRLGELLRREPVEQTL